MKKRVLIFATILSTSTHAAQVDGLVKVADDHSSVLAMIHNPTDKDVFCENISLDITRTGKDFGDFASRTHVNSGPVYVPAGQHIDLSALGTRAALANEGINGVAAANINVSACHSAMFSEFCYYADKTAEERHTTDLILRTARRDCDKAEAAVGQWLNLDRQNIRSIRAIGFLKNLRGLSLSRNMIDDLTPLKSLSQLAQLDIRHNPVRDLKPVLSLVSIRAVDARRTLVDDTSDPIRHLHKRGVRVRR